MAFVSTLLKGPLVYTVTHMVGQGGEIRAFISHFSTVPQLIKTDNLTEGERFISTHLMLTSQI